MFARVQDESDGDEGDDEQATIVPAHTRSSDTFTLTTRVRSLFIYYLLLLCLTLFFFILILIFINFVCFLSLLDD